MQNFRALCPQTPSLRRPLASGGWGLSPQTPKMAPRCKFLATRLARIVSKDDSTVRLNSLPRSTVRLFSYGTGTERWYGTPFL